MEAAGIHANKVPLPGDAESDGQRICLSLDYGTFCWTFPRTKNGLKSHKHLKLLA